MAFAPMPLAVAYTAGKMAMEGIRRVAHARARDVQCAGTAALGLIYTGCGAAIASRYESVNALLLPASAFVALLLLPLLPHFGLAPRWPFLLHPLEPSIILIRAGYGVGNPGELAVGIFGSVGWGVAAFWWGRNGFRALIREARATGGR